LLFFDLDDFKNINDNYGHSFGDCVLKNFAMVVSDVIRSFDLFCRYGGEEFILLLSNTDQQRGMFVGERIMKNLEQTTFAEKPDFKYTTSIGIYSGIPQRNETVEEYIDKADLAMYLAKKNGKNRIEIYKEKK
jgi:diguanylate cyclase